MPISISDIEAACENLASKIHETQLYHSRSCSDWLGARVYLKYENRQMTGSFKIRGAYNKILSLSKNEKRQGVVTSSAGNHAQGVALSAAQLGIKAYIVMPENSPLVKISATQSHGAEVILYGEFYDEAYELARQLEKEKGYIFIHPFEDPAIIAGQGTIGLEIFDKLPDVDSVLVPIGGGGLISGIATAIKTKRPECKVFGVISENTPGMYHLFKGEKGVKFQNRSTIADGTAVKTPSETMYKEYLSRLVDDVVRVKDDDIAEAMVFLLEKEKTVVEGAGAMAVAAAAQKAFALGEKSAMVLSGGNVDLNALAKIIERGLGRKGRLARLKVVVGDVPGTMHRLTAVISQQRANILEIYHDRLGTDLDIRETSIEFLLEVRSFEHVQKLKQALAAIGTRVI